MAARVVEAVRGAMPLSAAAQPQAPAATSEPAHTVADGASDGETAQRHSLAHVPFGAMLVAEALAVYCLTRLMMSLVRPHLERLLCLCLKPSSAMPPCS